jgi:hypothetical protein
LKYLGQTQKDPFKYKGSGTHWKRHLKFHGNNVSTDIILKDIANKDELRVYGLWWSKILDVVESSEWANLNEEAGDGGGGFSEATKQKISESLKGNTNSKGKPKSKTKGMGRRKGWHHSEEWKRKMSLMKKGKPKSNETKRKMSLAKIGHTNGFQKGQIPWNKGLRLAA